MIIDSLKPSISAVLTTAKSIITSIGAQYADFAIIGLAILLGWLLFRYDKKKNSKMVTIGIYSVLTFLIFVLA